MIIYDWMEKINNKKKKIPPSPETYAFPLFLITFEWLTPLMWTGFWKTLELEDLFDLEKRDKVI